MNTRPNIFATLIIVALSCTSHGTQNGEWWPMEKSKRYQFLEDFDNDGDIDVLLSQPISNFGNAGGGFTLYLRDGDELKEAGMIFAHPKAIAVEHFWKHSKIWVYQRGGGNVGMLGFYKLEEGKLSEFKGVEINPGDGGTDFSNALVDVVMNSKNTIAPTIIEITGEVPKETVVTTIKVLAELRNETRTRTMVEQAAVHELKDT